MTLDEVFGCSQGRVCLDLARRRDRIVDTRPDVAAYRGGLARVGLAWLVWVPSRVLGYRRRRRLRQRLSVLIPQVRLAHKYPISPWEMIHPPGGYNPVCM
jgi:hypothetical protein